MSSDPAASQPRYRPLLTLVSLALVGGVAVLFGLDVWRTKNGTQEQDKAENLAKAALAEVNDPAKGWYPFARDPAYGWEGSPQGWVLDDGTLAPSVSPAQPRVARAPAEIRKKLKAKLIGVEEKAAPETKMGPPKPGPVAEPKAPKAEPAAPGTPAVPAKEAPAAALSVAAPGTEGQSALQVPVEFPEPVTLMRDISRSTDADRLLNPGFIAYDVFIPPDCPGFVGCLFFMKDKDGLWYQARSRMALLPGRWTTLTADLRGGSADVAPLGHQGQWDANQASRIQAIGLTFYGDKAYTGNIKVDNFRAWMRPQSFFNMVALLNGNAPASQQVPSERVEQLRPLQDKAAEFKETAPVAVLNFRTEPAVGESGAVVRKFDTLTLRFELNRAVDNPFNPEQADITCLVETPSGKAQRHIGFWYQDYDRSDRFTGDELNPVGRPEWRVRITPREEGTYKYALSVKLRNEPELKLAAREFTAIPADTKSKGFVRVSKSDPRFFEFENGEFYYPIGHNLHSPTDIRCWREIYKKEPPAGRGLGMYADYFDKMQANGENTAEVWMASWWVGIEWTPEWPNFYGAGRYSLQNAWKLDTLLDMAQEHGINIHLVLDNHGKFSSWCDWEWPLNPYNALAFPETGVAQTANEFFTEERAKKLHQQKLRYIAARWGADPTILGFELVSEFDLVGGVDRRPVRSSAKRPNQVHMGWAREMMNFLRSCDPYGHLVTNHYATDYQYIDWDLARSELFDYVVTDAYRTDKNYTGAALRMYNWNKEEMAAKGAVKPYWITEYGGDFNAATLPQLESDVRCGPWATWMTDGAGTPLFWWYDLVDQEKLWYSYKAFNNYAKGEDRRGIKGESRPIPVADGNGLLAQGYRWPQGTYGWVYNDQAMRNMPPRDAWQKHENTRLLLTVADNPNDPRPENLAPGLYNVEYWDINSGEMVKKETIEAPAGKRLMLHFPAFQLGMAFKVKQAPAGTAVTPSAPPPPRPPTK